MKPASFHMVVYVMPGRKTYRYVLAILCCFLGHSRGASAEEQRRDRVSPSEIAAIKSFSDSCRNIREERYGNVHMILNESVTSQNTVNMHYTVEVEFWSRDNQYFRIDTTVTRSSNPKHKVGTRRRMIFSPEGTVFLRSDSAEEPFTIRRWEQNGENVLAQLLGMRWFQAAVRTASGIDADMILNGLAGLEIEDGDSKEYLKLCSLSDIKLTKDGSRLELNWQEQSESSTRHFFSEFDVERGVVLKGELTGFDTNGSPRGTITEVKHYQFDDFDCIPASYVQKYLSEEGAAEHVFQTKRVDWSPVPLGVFSLEAQGITSIQPQGVWQRRLWVVFCGLTLFVIVYLVKRARHRAT